MNTAAKAGLMATAMLTLMGCGPSYQDLPLPGAGRLEGSYQVDATFTDVLNLSQGAEVKMTGLPVGRIESVHTDGVRAIAVLDIENAVTLRRGSQARLRYDTPLGELFVEITPAAKGAPLTDGDTLTVRDTSTAPTVEDTLAQASLLINGGGLTQLQTINTELNTALGGREATVRRVLDQSRRFLAGANASSADIDALLRHLAAASTALDRRRRVIGDAVRAIGPMAQVLDQDTGALTTLLAGTERLTRHANQTMDRTQTALVQTLSQLGPILEEILEAKREWVHSLTALRTASALLREAVPGDFIGLDVLLWLDPEALLTGGTTTPTPTSTGPGLPDLPGLLSGGSSGTDDGSDPVGTLLDNLGLTPRTATP
jgi:phospholipid/cholesterol/gamma-HCH transport system substrate-binding protein